jgi:hypothetical protein
MVPVAAVITGTFLGAFVKLRKATVSFIMPVSLSACPSVRPFAGMEQFGFNWTDFHEILYWAIFRKSVESSNVNKT